MAKDDDRQSASIWGIKKTESGWIATLDAFFVEFTPRWFQFVGWLFALGGLQFLKDRSSTGPFIAVLYETSFAVFFMYLQATMYRLPLQRLLPSSLIRRAEFARTFSMIAAGILVTLLWFLLPTIVKQLSFK